MRKLVPLALALLFALGLLAYASDDSRSTSWQALELQGKTLELVDDSRLEIYKFLDEGRVIASWGLKKGPVTGPILEWWIDGQGRLNMSVDLREAPLKQLQAPEIRGDTVTAKRASGAQVRFKLSTT